MLTHHGIIPFDTGKGPDHAEIDFGTSVYIQSVSPSVKEDIKAAHRRHMEDFKRFAENQE